MRRSHYWSLFRKSNFLLFLPFALFAAGSDFSADQVFCDLEIVQKIDRKRTDILPLMVNYQGQGGYFNMPSARTFNAGDLNFGFSYVPPYHIWNLGFQFFDHLETTGNYWVFKGMLEQNFGHHGFGDDADRAANVKLIFLRKEDNVKFLPELAIGWNDFLGTRRFYSFYATATKQWTPLNLETTLGWGTGRIQGFYGGVSWSPFRNFKYFFKDLILAAEYDANDYEKHTHEHPRGRDVSNRINAGAQLKLWDLFRFSVSSLRGKEVAGSAAFTYNFGSTSGFFPKIYNPPMYMAPVDTEPLGPTRKEQALAQDLVFAFKDQGFDLYSLYLVPKGEGKESLWIKLINVRYREACIVRERVQRVLSALSPSNICEVTVVVEAEGVPVYEYCFRTQDLERYKEGFLGDKEFDVIAPIKEAQKEPTCYESTCLYHRTKPIWTMTFRPWVRTFFGSSRGKFKYEAGFLLGPEGYLFNQIYYCLYGTYTAKSSVQKIGSQDTLNPSRIINVRTDSLKYNQSSSFHIPQAFIQRSWNLGRGFFSRIALGYFEIAYAGLATEALYYPVGSSWAIGVEAATVLKRKYFGLGFQRKIRRWSPDGEVWSDFTGLQYFLDLYYQYKPYNLNFKIQAGQFLARDKGARFEGSRIFKSGLQVGLWYTLTNAYDVVNGDRYFDKGFFVSAPLDFFLNKSSRSRIGYGMAAWLRDVGAQSASGKQLYPNLFWERNPSQ